MSPIRLLFVLTSAVRGGVEEVVLALATRLDRSEFRVAIAAPATLLDAFAADLARHPVDTLPVDAESWLRRAEVDRFARFLRAWRPEIVNPHLFRSTLVSVPLARWHGVPAIVETYHGREGWRQDRLSSSHDRAPGRSIVARTLGASFALDRAMSHLIDRVIAVSEAARDFLVHGKGYAARKVVVVPNGRDLTTFTPGVHREQIRKELGLDGSVPIAGVVGRLEMQKGHAYLLEAWPAVLAELPDARLVLAGDGSLRDALVQKAGALGIADRVIFLGFRPDVPRVLDAIDVLALPSLYEGMPLTAIEAAAMARPVVATAVDGTVEVVRDGVTGSLVPPGDPPALARALTAILGDPPRAARMGASGRAWACERFDLDRQVEATARVYRSALA
ncbi:MAG: glycosyltransferase family 4 protein [Candidatus Rokubacteria bacterium]|nr:glycosyltransferase family 4 protein [Candidatus Rokubacteria bacterium]